MDSIAALTELHGPACGLCDPIIGGDGKGEMGFKVQAEGFPLPGEPVFRQEVNPAVIPEAKKDGIGAAPRICQPLPVPGKLDVFGLEPDRRLLGVLFQGQDTVALGGKIALQVSAVVLLQDRPVDGFLQLGGENGLRPLRRSGLCSPGIRAQEHRRGGAEKQGKNGEQKTGCSVVHHRLDAALHPRFPEGQRTQEAPRPGAGAVQQGGGIPLPLRLRKAPDDPLVAAELQVPAEQEPAEPEEGTEPEDAEDQPAQELPPGVSPAEMGPFMPQRGFPQRFLQICR